MRIESTASLPPQPAAPRADAGNGGPPPATRAAAAAREGLRNAAPAEPQGLRPPQIASRAEEADGVEMEVEARLNELLADTMGSNRRLRVRRDDSSDRFVYQSVDRSTGEVLTQFPPETLLKVIAAIRSAEGLLLDREA